MVGRNGGEEERVGKGGGKGGTLAERGEEEEEEEEHDAFNISVGHDATKEIASSCKQSKESIRKEGEARDDEGKQRTSMRKGCGARPDSSRSGERNLASLWTWLKVSCVRHDAQLRRS